MANEEKKDPDWVSLNEKNLDRIIAWSARVDAKAGFILTVILVLLGYLATHLNPLFEAHVRCWGAHHDIAALLLVLDLLLLLALFGLIASFACLLNIIRPKLIPPSAKPSLFFFQTIAAMPLDDYQKKMGCLTEAEIIAEVSDQAHNNAKVMAGKFRSLQISINWFWVGFGAFVPFSLLRPLFIKMLGL